MEPNPLKAFGLFMAAFILLYVWNAYNVPKWGIVPFGFVIALCVIKGVRAWRGGPAKNTLLKKGKR